MGVTLIKMYLPPAALLLLAALVQFPLFTLYISPITNFFRTIYAGFYWLAGFPAGAEVLAISVALLFGVTLLEFSRPRVWCRHLCPVGKTYGLFNGVSLIHVKLNPVECTSCRACEDACYQRVEILSPPSREKVRDSSCILCGRCVEACRARTKAVSLGFGI